MNTIIESLRGDAALLAMDIGEDDLMVDDGSGFKKLVDAVRAKQPKSWAPGETPWPKAPVGVNASQ